MPHIHTYIRVFFVVLLLSGLSLQGRARAETAAEIDENVAASLGRFLTDHGAARDLIDKSAGVLVFPKVVKAGFGFGGEYGEGALRVNGQTVDYYNTVTVSFGFQLGVQMRSVFLVFLTDKALSRFRASDGWEVGVDGSIAVITLGIGETLDTNSIRGPVVAFITDQKGLMYNLTLEGSKMTKIEK